MVLNNGELTDSKPATAAPSSGVAAPGELNETCAGRAGCVPSTTAWPSTTTESKCDPKLASEPKDFPQHKASSDGKLIVWNQEEPPASNYPVVGAHLAAAGDLFRAPGCASGLILASAVADMPPAIVNDAGTLDAIIIDRLAVEVRKNGQLLAHRIPSADRAAMLKTEMFLQRFAPLDMVTTTPIHLPDFTLTRPGYNDGGRGHRILYAGPPPAISNSTTAITLFLDVMAFASNADRTNAVAAALTVKLRTFWCGAKPLIGATAWKSQSGKDTLIDFSAGKNRSSSVTYQATDWAFERAIVGAFRLHPDTVLLRIDNARLYGNQAFIASGFLEGLITNPEPTFFSTGTGGPTSRANNFIVAIATNEGSLSTDLNNRSLPIRLEAVGNVEDRVSPIGNPRLEYLPANRDLIDAELNGMIERWKAEGQPLAKNVRHPFTQWAQTIGGILEVNGFADFLTNFSYRKSADDPLRKALGLLGAAAVAQGNDAWRTPAEWARLAVSTGLVKQLVPAAERHSEQGRERAIGVVLTAHKDETVRVDTDDLRLALRIRKERRRFVPGGPASTRYRFEILERHPIPADADGGAGAVDE